MYVRIRAPERRKNYRKDKGFERGLISGIKNTNIFPEGSMAIAKVRKNSLKMLGVQFTQFKTIHMK
jgi:hypothetical protein